MGWTGMHTFCPTCSPGFVYGEQSSGKLHIFTKPARKLGWNEMSLATTMRYLTLLQARLSS